MSRAVLRQLEDQTLVGLAVAGSAWPRGLLSDTPLPDKWMGLVITPDGRRRFVPAGEDPRPERDDTLVLIRNRPLTVPLEIADAPAAEGHAVRGNCELLVRWPAREDELAALHEALLAAGPLSLSRLAQTVAHAGALAALRSFIAAHPAQRLVREDLRDKLLAALRQHLKRFAFESGLELERVANAQFASESLEAQQALRRRARQRVERIRAAEMIAAAARAAAKRRLDHLAEVLAKLKAAADDEDMQWHQLLPALSPAERGQLLENLWRITPDRQVAAALAVVAGNECLLLEPGAPEKLVRRFTLSEELGGLRSVSFVPPQRWLLVGAASGVWAVRADSGEPVARFAVPGRPRPRTGFNAAVIAGDQLYATHSELGCWRWPLQEPAAAEALLEPTDGVPQRIRAVVAGDDGRIFFSADDCVHVYQPQTGELSVLGSGTDTIHCLAALEDRLFVGCDDGKLFRVDLNHPDDWWLVQQLSDPIESVQVRRWSDLFELVVPAGARGVSGIYDEQRVVVCLLESPTPIRRAWACDDLVVGLSRLRDRLVVMNANLPSRRALEVRIGRLTGHSIHDACIVLRPEARVAGEPLPGGEQA